MINNVTVLQLLSIFISFIIVNEADLIKSRLYLDYIVASKRCPGGLIASEDTIELYASVRTGDLPAGTPKIIRLEVQEAVENKTLCSLDIEKTPCFWIASPKLCHCTKRTPLHVEMISHLVANVSLSNKTVQLNWRSFSNGQNYISNTRLLPLIYDQEFKRLKINGFTIPSICVILLPSRKTLTSVEWCVTGLSKHVTNIKSKNEVLVSTEGDCVSYDFANHMSAGDLKLSYAEEGGCRRNSTYSCSYGPWVNLKRYRNLQYESMCSSLFLAGTDMVVFVATLFATKAEIGERAIIQFQLSFDGNLKNFRKLCTINLNTNNCTIFSPKDLCYCTKSALDSYEFVLNMTARSDMSEKLFRVRWTNELQMKGEDSNIQKMPRIYDYVKEIVLLKFGTSSIDPHTCRLSLTRGSTYIVRFCVFHIPSIRVAMNFSVAHDQSLEGTQACIGSVLKVRKEHFGKVFEFTYQEIDACSRSAKFMCRVSEQIGNVGRPWRENIGVILFFVLLAIIIVGYIIGATITVYREKQLRLQQKGKGTLRNIFKK